MENDAETTIKRRRDSDATAIVTDRESVMEFHLRPVVATDDSGFAWHDGDYPGDDERYDTPFEAIAALTVRVAAGEIGFAPATVEFSHYLGWKEAN